jgi:hypothetical protein
MLINPIIRTRTRHCRRAYHPTRDSIMTEMSERGQRCRWRNLDNIRLYKTLVPLEIFYEIRGKVICDDYIIC